MYAQIRSLKNVDPIAPEVSTSQQTMEKKLGNEVYNKGAWVIHMLRYLVGKETMLRTLRRFAYPTPESERSLDGSACHFATTDDFIRTANQMAGQDLGWFFTVYLRRGPLPRLVSTFEGDRLTLRWEAPDKLLFPMPVEIEVDGKIERVEMPGGHAELIGARYAHARLDPNLWILKEARLADVQPPKPAWTKTK